MENPEPSVLSTADFAAYFEALWSKTPFPWQQVLAERVLAGGPRAWPPAITLPTASGKTACLDIALFALAAQADRQARGETSSAALDSVPDGPPGASLGASPGAALTAHLTTPRRIFFVVDRRVIVDEAFERAKAIAGKLAQATDGILACVARRLRLLAGGEDEAPLACFQLRGGIYRDDAWARSPIQPTIVCSTVDQIGSRLLFRAYGRSFKAWHLQAGLAGNDCLILLDEAHCAEPFMETLNAVARYRQWAEEPVALPFETVILTATPPQGVTPFPDTATERANREHPVLKRRIEAPKPCALRVAEKARGADAGKVNQALAQVLAAEAERLVQEANAQGAGAPAVAVFCNRVDTARRAFRLLAGRHGDRAVLLTGRMRPLDKDDTIAAKLALLAADAAEDRRLEAPLFVVATQTLEVGANLDFDLMVSECADLSALRQRFGRLNRMGRPIDARGLIVVRADQQAADSPPDPVYGSALSHTWNWLQQELDPRDGRDRQDRIDLGIAALSERLPADRSQLIRAAHHAPVMLPAHLDALCQTAPVPQPSPDIALFLHGPESGPADVQVCWRADLAPDLAAADDREAAWIEAVTLCPPASGELMPVPLGAFRRWMAGEPESADRGDVEGGEPEPEPAPAAPRKAIAVLRWRGREDSAVIEAPGAIRPGDVLVVPSGLGGWEAFGHIPEGAAIDLGDRANRNARSRALLRLTRGTLADWPDTPARRLLLDLLGASEQRLEDDSEGLAGDLREALRALARDEAATWLGEIAGHLVAGERRLERCIFRHPAGGLVVQGTRRLSPQPRIGSGGVGDGAGSDFTHEDDASASGTVAVSLPVHLRGVRDFARRHSGHLPRALSEDIALAALAHDLGKADPRFQALLHGGNPWARGPLLAKSGSMPQGYAAYRSALAASGYPPHARHELLSVRLLESAPQVLQQANDPDLVLHLIASHHGHCRPFAPIADDPDPQRISLHLDLPEFAASTLTASSATGLERLDSGVAERFWRLIRRYGWWGLAGLEAILLLSDHRRSEWEEKHPQGVEDE